MTTVKRNSSAAVLLDALITAQDLTRADIATALAVSVEAIDGYRSGAEGIPLQHQLWLALRAARNPSLARKAHRLRAQVLAAMAFATRGESTLGTVQRGWWKA